MEDNKKFEATFRTLQGLEGKKAKIKCVGIGGGGGNAINHMMDAGIAGTLNWGKKRRKNLSPNLKI